MRSSRRLGRWLVTALALTVLAASVGACSDSDSASSGSSGSGSSSRSRDADVYTPKDTTIAVENGHTFTVALPVTSGTGYTWQAEANDDLQLVDSEVVQAAERPGATATQELTLRAQASGSGTVRTTLTLDYVRPWEGGGPPAETQSFKVEITT